MTKVVFYDAEVKNVKYEENGVNYGDLSIGMKNVYQFGRKIPKDSIKLFGENEVRNNADLEDFNKVSFKLGTFVKVLDTTKVPSQEELSSNFMNIQSNRIDYFNIPSFEIFTSPDWRGTNGTIKFNQPLYYSGKRIAGVSLKFENGLVVTASATENEDALKEMIAQENANRVGEFSLTDKRHSRITKFMATTLFDENMGGEFGNTHIALGNAYKDTYTGDMSGVTDQQWSDMGYNSCPKVHTDIISTSNRMVTATLRNTKEMTIYKDGQFVLD